MNIVDMLAFIPYFMFMNIQDGTNIADMLAFIPYYSRHLNIQDGINIEDM